MEKLKNLSSVHKDNEADTAPIKQKTADSLSFTESAADLAHVEAFSQWLYERGDALPDDAFSERLERTEDSLMQ